MMTFNELFNKHKAKKKKHYGNIYDSWFEKDRLKVTSVLEIGIYEGHSLNVWAEYFSNAEIYGIDIAKREWDFISDRIHTFIGNQSDEEFLKTFGEFDIVFDDASHRMKDQKKSFNILFKHLKPGGIYVIEDLHTSYWPKYDGKFKGKKTTIEKLKSYVDCLNYRAYKQDRRAENHRSKSSISFFDKKIESVHFYKSLCFIRRHR